MMKPSLEDLVDKYNNGTATAAEKALLMAYYDALENEDGPLISDSQREVLKNEISGAIDLAIDKTPAAPVTVWLIARKGLPVAAALTGLLVSGWWLLKPNGHNLPVQPPVETRQQVAKVEKRSFIVLPDSSRVVLEPGSTLEYPDHFAEQQPRRVKLTGAAFFDVTHRDSSVFEVLSDKINITVLGTAFHIRAWPGEKENSVVVTRGKVQVQAGEQLLGMVSPAEQLRYNKQEESPHRSTIQPGTAHDSNDEIALDDVSLDEAFRLIETVYAIEISTEPSIDKTRRFSGTIIKGERLQEVMNRVATFNRLTYQLHDDGKRMSIGLLAR